ncbi:MAG: CcoQ/FixQ family Cbb3-type cytochrome c oxidase assembly chaperone [Candidatus Dadabacteria bacterium]|nr:MAG: CcoQ/FixQ family Cbb3-type cytochrome c oxidase assembly chaperone [Candidatus Dadabacteria bacterium]
MIREVLAQGDTVFWQQLALILFIVAFILTAIWTWRRGRRDELEALKYLPLDDEKDDTEGAPHGA